ncbi:MAG TPA: hypothetical protein VFE32_02920 [Puia sp.]|nr:hypothetical protein [Puia sp.]
MRKEQAMDEQKELKEKIEEWIKKEGVPLEYFSATTFRTVGFTTFQGYYAKGSEKRREIDTLAYQTYEVNGSYLRLHSVAECKWSRDKPWVVFNSQDTVMSEAAAISQTIGNEVGSALLWYVAGESELHLLELFNKAKVCGFSGRQALADKKSDLFYDTMQGVISKTLEIVNDYDRIEKDGLKWITIGFPLIIIDAPLFEVSYNAAMGTLETNETEHARLHWRGSNDWKFIATVDVVTKDYLPTYVARLKKQFDDIHECVTTRFDDIKRFCETGNPELLQITDVSRGISGQPWFFTQRTRFR